MPPLSLRPLSGIGKLTAKNIFSRCQQVTGTCCTVPIGSHHSAAYNTTGTVLGAACNNRSFGLLQTNTGTAAVCLKRKIFQMAETKLSYEHQNYGNTIYIIKQHYFCS